MYVPAHTSKVGFYSQDVQTSFQDRPRRLDYFGNEIDWGSGGYVRAIAYSNKCPSTPSDGILPTYHFRKVAKITGGQYHAMDDWHESKGDSLTWCSIYTLPCGNPYYTPAVTIPSWMVDHVVQKVTLDLMDLKANILEDFGQARQTVSMLASLFNTIVKLYTIARRGQWRKLRRLLRGLGHRPAKKASNGWLMFYYGIKPLVSTFDAICAGNEPKLKTVTRKRKISQSVDPYEFASAPGAKVDGLAEQRCMCGLTASLNMDSSLSYWSSLGLTNDYISDALVTAWALTPYSFVLDWILPVEQFLRTRSFSSGITALHSYISRSQVASVVVRATWVPGISSWEPWGTLPQAKVRSLMYYREVYYGIVPPSGLSLNTSLTPTNLISAAALIIQRR